MIRTRKLPGSYSDAEITKVETDAAAAKKKPQDHVRDRLGLVRVGMGNPKLSRKIQHDMASGDPNQRLSASTLYQHESCIYCGRQYPETILNIEGMIYHGEPFRCVDTKSCARAARKRSR